MGFPRQEYWSGLTFPCPELKITELHTLSVRTVWYVNYKKNMYLRDQNIN